MNVDIKNKKIKNFINVWQDKKSPKKDINKKNYPDPTEFKKYNNKEELLSLLKNIQKNLTPEKKEKTFDCIICRQKNISTCFYETEKFVWEDSLIHYIEKHDIEIPDKFLDYIFYGKIPKMTLLSRFKKDNLYYYVKLKRNQIMIMDALMYHGGYDKKYKSSGNDYKYSEHMGLLDFDKKNLESFIISAKTSRIDKNDDDIFLPKGLENEYEYEYIFHTHPPTPKPGGRVTMGILYEFPSTSDIFHFIEHFNEGKTIGSIVITPEGMYNIRKKNFDKIKLDINENSLFKEYHKELFNQQDIAIKKFGKNITTSKFYSKVSQDVTYIENINKVLNKYEMHIDFYPRKKDSKGKWIIDDVYLKILYNNY